MTAANSSSLDDGAAALLIGDRPDGWDDLVALCIGVGQGLAMVLES